MQKNRKIGSITDSCGIVIALVYQHRDGGIDAGEIGETRDMNDLQGLLAKGFAFRPWKKDLHPCDNPLGKSTRSIGVSRAIPAQVVPRIYGRHGDANGAPASHSGESSLRGS